jgi:hypothetical protein
MFEKLKALAQLLSGVIFGRRLKSLPTGRQVRLQFVEPKDANRLF